MMLKLFFTINLLLISTSLLGQSQKDTISNLVSNSFEKLESKFYKLENNTNQAQVYGLAYIKKAKIQKDTLRICKGYHLLAYLYYNELSFTYADSIIDITRSQSFKDYPLAAYLMKADLYYRRKNFKASFDNYVIAKSLIKKEEKEVNYYINHQIGGIKAKLLLNQDALKIFKESWKFVNEENYETKNKSEYLQALVDLSIQYVRNKKLDSATALNKLGIKESLLVKDHLKYNLLVLNEGINLFYQQRNDIAKDSISKTIPFFKQEKNYECLSFCYFYLGKISYQNKEYEESIHRLKQVDTIFRNTKNIHPIIIEGYELLVNHYKSIGDKEKTLNYIEKLLEADKVITSNYKYLSSKIVREYDTPKLLSEKEEIIQSIRKNKNLYLNSSIVLFSLVIIFFVLWRYNFKKRKQYKVRFEELLEMKTTDSTSYSQKLTVSISEDKIKDIGISEEVVEKILKQLRSFEHNKEYLSQGITIGSLAKKMNTNSKYLSLVINHFNKKSFVSYVNELRIKYTVERLKTDMVFRKYTIKAIANEAGFNSTESFSSAFYKQTQLKPSYFLKKLSEVK